MVTSGEVFIGISGDTFSPEFASTPVTLPLKATFAASPVVVV